MRVLKLLVVAIFAAALIASFAAPTRIVYSQSEAPAGFDNLTNGFTDQATFDADRAAFEAREEIADGLGPVYNAQACAECHQNPVTGGISQIFELRAGHSGPDGSFVAPPGGPLIQARAVNAMLQERVPDGPRIVVSGELQNISVLGFDGGQYGAVGNTPVRGFFPCFSPDGTRIAFGDGLPPFGNIWVMNNDGTGLQQITTAGVDHTPAWSPDGTKIAFSRRVGGVGGVFQIFTMNPDGTNQTRITNSPSNDTEPAWSPDGTQIAFARTLQSINPRSDIWVMTASGGGQTQITATLTANEGRPAWSPDGTQIAFHTDRDGNWEIYKMTSAGLSQTRLTNHAAQDKNPAWSPDGAMIAFGSLRNSPGSRIWIMATDGSNQTRIDPQFGDGPSYSKDQGETVRTFRASLNVLGDGFVEATDDATFIAIRDAQPVSMRGTAISVPVAEAPGETRLGRFGWKNSVASLLTFSAGAYRLEQGITSPLQPDEDTSLGRNVSFFDGLPGMLEDTGGPQGFGEDVEAFTRFMRSTKAPPRDRLLVPDDATDPGSALFDSLSCSVCHTRSITTTPNPATTFHGGTFLVGTALANKTFHPFGDFLLHDIGTGDGIVETNGELTRNKVRTAPLWGLRTRDRLMHDGGSSSPPSNSGAQSFAISEAILRHAGQAAASRTAFQALTPVQKAQLFKFLKSL